MSKLAKALAVLSALLPFCNSGSASIVYDNATTDLNQTYFGGNGVEFGDQITLAGTDRIVNDIKFQYFLGSNASGNETLQLVLRANDGATITVPTPGGGTRDVTIPGTILYTSPVLSLQPGFQTAEASDFTAEVSNSFTWSVTLNGIDNGETAGLLLYNPPTIGSSFDDFWQNSGGSWNTYLIGDGSTPANFAARVSAVPEPGTLALALLAGLGGLGYFGFKRRSA